MLTVWRSARFDRWMRKLRDNAARARVLLAVDALALRGEPVGDWKRIAGTAGMYECRIHAGRGYRLYYAFEGGALLLLLAGGDKASQRRDIAEARSTLEDWRAHHGD